MKTIVFSLLWSSALAMAAQAQSGGAFDLSWHTIDGGGSPSAGGGFSLNGTIGQPDAGTMSGGNYSLAGGFWGLIPAPSSIPTVIELWLVGNDVHLRFSGIPGRTYDIERASSLTGPWPPNTQALATITIPTGGVVEFVDTTGLIFPQSFYRTRLR
jgi:hypothetical protein